MYKQLLYSERNKKRNTEIIISSVSLWVIQICSARNPFPSNPLHMCPLQHFITSQI